MQYFAVILLALVAAAFGQNSCNCVVFRLDDIQDYYINKAQLAVMGAFKDSKTPLSIGIIANYFGQDESVVGYIKSSLQGNSWDLEIADHGWNHEDFSTMTRTQQKNTLSNAVTKIAQVLSPYGNGVDVFIPPFNAYNADTLSVLEELGFHAMSSQTDMDTPNNNGVLKHWPIGAATSDVAIQDAFVPIPAATTFSDIQDQIARFGYAAVMLHPQEFCVLNGDRQPTNAVNNAAVNELRSLLSMVKSAGITSVTFSEVSGRFGGNDNDNSYNNDNSYDNDDSNDNDNYDNGDSYDGDYEEDYEEDYDGEYDEDYDNGDSYDEEYDDGNMMDGYWDEY